MDRSATSSGDLGSAKKGSAEESAAAVWDFASCLVSACQSNGAEVDQAGVEAALNAVNDASSPASCSSSSQEAAPVSVDTSTAPLSDATPLLPLLLLISNGDADTQSLLLSMFPSCSDLFAFAVSDDVVLRDQARNMLPDFCTRNRFFSVLKYLQMGGVWHSGLAFEDIATALSSPTVASGIPPPCPEWTGGDSFPPAAAAAATEKEGSSAIEWIKPPSKDVEAKVAWNMVEVADFNPPVDLAEQTYAEGARGDMLMRLEKEIGVKLNMGKQPQVRRCADGSGIMETFCTFICKGKMKEDEQSKRIDRKIQCPYKLMVATTLEDQPTTRVYAWDNHTCDPDIDYSARKEALTGNQKKYVLDKINQGKSPLQVHLELVNEDKKKLRGEGLYLNNGQFPKLEQIQNFAKNQCRDSLYQQRNTVDRITELCEKLSKVPEDEDQPYVIDYQITSASDFNVVMTTRRLLLIFSVTMRRNLDGTYKLLKSGHCVLLMGVDDAERKYHPAILSISATEQRKDFYFMVNAQMNHQTQPQPEIHLMADSAPAIVNGMNDATKLQQKRKRHNGDSTSTIADALSAPDTVTTANASSIADDATVTDAVSTSAASPATVSGAASAASVSAEVTLSDDEEVSAGVSDGNSFRDVEDDEDVMPEDLLAPLDNIEAVGKSLDDNDGTLVSRHSNAFAAIPFASGQAEKVQRMAAKVLADAEQMMAVVMATAEEYKMKTEGIGIDSDGGEMNEER